MSVEAALHRLWEMDAVLSAVVPAARVYTGLAPPGLSFPYVTLERTEDQSAERTSSGTTLLTAVWRWNVWDVDLDRAKQAAAAIARRYQRASFDFSQGQAHDCRWLRQTESQQADGAWRVAVDLQLRISQTEG